jgi:hypothetical protein
MLAGGERGPQVDEFLKALVIWIGFFSAFFGLLRPVFWGVNKDDGRSRYVAWLRHDGFARRYRHLLDAGLNRLDAWLSPEFPLAPTDHKANRKTEPARAWSWRLLDLCLLLAVAYPVLAVLLDWTITGDVRRIGVVEVLPQEPDLWRRMLLVSSLTAVVYALMISRKHWVTDPFSIEPFSWGLLMGGAGVAAAFAFAV